MTPLPPQAGRRAAGEAAGAVALSNIGRTTVTTKSDGTPLTQADLASQDVLRLELRRLLPDAGWLSEDATILVHDGEITFPVFAHCDGTLGGWGHNLLLRGDVGGTPPYKPVIESHTAPLAVPVTDRVRELFARTTLTLVEGR